MGKRYELADIKRHIKQLAGQNMAAFFVTTVEGNNVFDFTPHYREFGLDLDYFHYDEVYVRPEASATAG